MGTQKETDLTQPGVERDFRRYHRSASLEVDSGVEIVWGKFPGRYFWESHL